MSYNRERYLMRKYGITEAQYLKMFDKQQGCCAICGKHQSELKMRLDVDHDHKLNFVRGLLCRYCNSKLMKYLRDDSTRGAGLVKYLQKWLRKLKNETKKRHNG